MSASLASVLELLAVLASDAWVFIDARRCASEGCPVFARIGALTLNSPAEWLAGCVVLWIVFFPMYLLARRN